MKKKVIQFKNARFTLLSDFTYKAEYSSDGRFINKELFITDLHEDQPYNTPARCKVVKKDDLLTIETDKLVIRYKAEKNGFSRKNLHVLYTCNKRRVKWVYGQKDRKNLGGTTLDLFKYPKIRGRRLSQGVLSRSGYFTYYDDTFIFSDKEKKWAEYERREGYNLFFFIGYGDDFKAGLKEFSIVFGKAVLPPLWAFGLWYSRYWAYHQDELIKLAEKYRSLHIPLDVMVVDTDWRKNIWRGYQWSDKYFPDPKVFIKVMKKMKIKLTLNDHPGYNESEFLPQDEPSYKPIIKILNLEKGTKWRVNWRRKEEVKAFCNILLKPKLKEGIDFWWIDGWGAEGFSRNEKFFLKKRNADRMGLGIEGYYGLNPQLWLNHFYYETIREAHNKRPLLLTRWGGYGSQRYPVWFSGDTCSTFKTLAYQVYFTYTAGNVLTNYWSHDLGGFLGKSISKELYIRWIQFGAFSPIMRTHSDHGIREPWGFDKQATDVFKKYVRLRYRLIPYFYQYAYISYEKGLPLIRGLYHNYPEYREYKKFREQYFIGDDILVAPVVRKMRGRRIIKKRVFFPEGEWLGIEDGFMTMGPAKAVVRTPLERIPFFIRKNSIIPVNDDALFIDDKPRKNLRFEIFDPSYIQYSYYEDDGISEEYRKGHFLQIPLNIKRDSQYITIRIGKRKGRYKGMKQKRKILLAFHFTGDIMLQKAVFQKRSLKMRKADSVFGEIRSIFRSYHVNFPYNGDPATIILIMK
ncbi:MAG: DUF5110 domain-containing protein [Spirochaetes bacterium]|nr:DUF5110 domain-containing protein [Spirochaetota bacterium]